MEATEAAAAFSKQAPIFDGLNESNPISVYLRGQFREEVMKYSREGDTVLELNCGTGLDAMFLAGHGRRVFATDISAGMIEEFRRKLATFDHAGGIGLCQLSFEQLDSLNGRKFDHIISNFGGLNCSPELKSVLSRFGGLLNPGGTVTLMIMPRVCPWELAMAFKGKFKTAFRRIKGSARAKVEGESFTCYYYNPSYVIRALKKEFRLVSLKGVCITVPPEFYLGFAERYPRAFEILKRVDRSIGNSFPFNRMCDHFLVTLRKK